MINRRDFLGVTLGAGATLALTSSLLRALQQPGGSPPQPSVGKLIQRAIPSSGEMLPVIGLGRQNIPVENAAFKEVLKTLVDNGGSLLDTVHGQTQAEKAGGTAASELGIQSKIFWSTQVRTKAIAGARTELEGTFGRLSVPKIDLIQVSALKDDLPAYLAVLRELKKEGRVRYIGVTAAFDNQYERLESAMRKEPLDFISVDYAINNRNVEQTILPLAQEHKIAVLAYFPFGQGGSASGPGGLFRQAGGTPLPEWAADFDAKTWAQFFLKYVIGNPAVTAVRTGTSQAKHMLDNIGGGIGRLPNEATRKRMTELVDAWPPVGKQKSEKR